ncbi:MAG: phosphate ABC transporter substrate-binding protein [Phototrophicales bacterium]|nr:MAG: phosphate ABC transporter substrate-binding protein [Phototrophicales bacterium]
MSVRKLRVITFLAPSMEKIYRYTMDYAGRQLGYEMEFVVGEVYEDVFDADLSFICGLPYVLRTAPRLEPSPIEALVAPVLQGERYQGKPIYFSDVIVHRDSPFQKFEDLRGCSWAFNEPESQSGYGITRYSLLQMGETQGFFGEVIEAGFHQKAVRMVANKTVDASAIDSQVLAIELRDYPELAEQLRVIHTIGPSTIQPIAASSKLPKKLRQDLQAVFSEMHTDPEVADVIAGGFVERFVPVDDSDYNDIRDMLKACEAANFLELR